MVFPICPWSFSCVDAILDWLSKACLLYNCKHFNFIVSSCWKTMPTAYWSCCLMSDLTYLHIFSILRLFQLSWKITEAQVRIPMPTKPIGWMKLVRLRELPLLHHMLWWRFPLGKWLWMTKVNSVLKGNFFSKCSLSLVSD